nr:MAG TPA: hypothetical protein [Bacteriophage sp.]
MQLMSKGNKNPRVIRYLGVLFFSDMATWF